MKTTSKLVVGILLCAGFVQVTSSVTVRMTKEGKNMPLEYALVGKDRKDNSYKKFNSKTPEIQISFDEKSDNTLYIKGWGKPDNTAKSLQLPNRQVGVSQYDRIWINPAGVARYEKSKHDPSMKPMAN